MQFLSPVNFIWFLPLGVAIVALYLLKLRRKEKIISSVMLWAQAVQDVQANAPFQKLKKNILLLIQLAALLLAVVALARPYVRATSLVGQNIVLVIDSSGSMKAGDVSGTRFGQAKEVAQKTIDNLGRGDALMIISAASKTRVVSAFTSDKKALASSIANLKPTDTRVNLREALVLASSLVARKKHPQIVIISDGAFSGASDVHIPGASVNFVKIGKRSQNVGITAMDSRKTLAGVRQVLVGLKNCSDKSQSFNLEFYVENNLVDIREESLSPGSQKIEIMDVPATSQGGLVRAEIDIKDDLPGDNQAHIFLEKPKKLSVLVVTRGNLFLENALKLDPRTEVSKSSATPKKLTGYDMVVFDGIKPPSGLPRGSYVLVNTYSPSGPALPDKEVTLPQVVDWEKNHPVMRFVNLAEVGIQSANKLKPMSWGQTIIEGQQGPLAVAGEFEGRKFVVLGFDLQKTNLVMVPAFPILMANCLDWSTGRTGADVNISAKSGEAVPIEVPAATRSFTVTAPDGSKREVDVNSNPTYFDGTEQAGLYEIEGQGVDRRLAVNLLWPEESDTRPKDQVFIGEKKLKASTGGVKTNRELWRYAMLGLLGVLCLEWWVYHRR